MTDTFYKPKQCFHMLKHTVKLVFFLTFPFRMQKYKKKKIL